MEFNTGNPSFTNLWGALIVLVREELKALEPGISDQASDAKLGWL